MDFSISNDRAVIGNLLYEGRIYDGDPGIRIPMGNGYSISVVWGPYTYSDGGNTTAELAVFNDKGHFVRPASWGDHDDDVKGHQTVADFEALRDEVAAW